ncbi:MAG: hydrogenase iron-sulfur subunit, partial [Desulfobacteraceae bacterium]|nr:hydrogenase iron-sulfur subunit [Desulfobacteraceae bacterium]
VSKISDALASLALETERVQYTEIAIDEYDKLPEILNAFAEEIEEMGPNPFKGF